MNLQRVILGSAIFQWSQHCPKERVSISQHFKKRSKSKFVELYKPSKIAYRLSFHTMTHTHTMMHMTYRHIMKHFCSEHFESMNFCAPLHFASTREPNLLHLSCPADAIAGWSLRLEFNDVNMPKDIRTYVCCRWRDEIMLSLGSRKQGHCVHIHLTSN